MALTSFKLQGQVDGGDTLNIACVGVAGCYFHDGSTTWPSLAASDVDSNSFATEDVADGLFDRDIMILSVGTEDIQFAATTVTAASWADVTNAAWDKMIPDAATGMNYYVIVNAYLTTGGGNTGEIRIVETGGPTNGSATSVTETDTATMKTISIAVDAGWI